jgi:hypothetical protein
MGALVPLLFKTTSSSELLLPIAFPNEAELQNLLQMNPGLLRQDSDPPIAFVSREVDLKEAGSLDLLLVSRDGLPIAVEVKLQRNAQARREVVAQTIDYISALTSRTVDELDEMLGGRLETALRSFDQVDSDESFDARWRAFGSNLRAGKARLLVAVDGTTPGLERILRFLAENSELDVQLVVVERFAANDGQEVVVSRPTFSVESLSRVKASSDRSEIRSQLIAAADCYNNSARSDLIATGVSGRYRQIRPSAWPSGAKVHYEFYQTGSYLGAELHLESDRARSLADYLASLVGRPVVNGTKTIEWDPAWSNGRGRLTIRFALSDSPAAVAQGMSELIAITYPAVTERLDQLSNVAAVSLNDAAE